MEGRNFIGIETVSYTHLDVYKRQFMTCLRVQLKSNMNTLSVKKRSVLSSKLYASRCGRKPKSANSSNSNSVRWKKKKADVYKRQPFPLRRLLTAQGFCFIL